jgi:hypothetical protein
MGRSRSSSYFFIYFYVVMGSIGSKGSIGGIGTVLYMFLQNLVHTVDAVLASPRLHPGRKTCFRPLSGQQ